MTPSRRVRTTRQVAVAADVDTDRAIELLEELRAAGLAERCAGGWRISELAERKFGRTLRDLDFRDDEEDAA